MILQWNSTSFHYTLSLETFELSQHDKLLVHIRRAIEKSLVNRTGQRIVLRRRKRRPNYNRNNWEAIEFDKKDDPWFLRFIRMSLNSFHNLLRLVEDDLQVDAYMASKRFGQITPSLCLYMTLRHLAGGVPQDITETIGVSRSSLYRCVKKTLRVIAKCPALAISFPQTHAECQERADGFVAKSLTDAIVNCVSVVDGIHIRIKSPPKYVGNVRSYFSGHHHTTGINFQAACDEECRFTYAAMAGSGSANDRVAIKETKLYALMERMPKGFVVIGDAAYEPTERLIPLFYGAKRHDASYDNFNYYGSKLRIRIEMAFGMMVNKWPILEKPLKCDFRSIRVVLMAIVALHNFCINERIAVNDYTPQNRFTWSHSDEVVQYLPSVTMTIGVGEGDPIAPIDEPYLYRIAGHSRTRLDMMYRVRDMGLVRPP
jgi:DDE superfamily endonuclease